MAASPMPFITGSITTPSASPRLSPPNGDLIALIPLSKVQEVLWLDYIRRPWSMHYALTLKVDFATSKVSLENIISHIHQLGIENDMLRTTFHIDVAAQDLSQSYMAVHDTVNCVQNLDIISDDTKLEQALRRPFDLSLEYPVRWVINQRFAVEKGCLKMTYAIYAVGHHIAVDGSSMSHLSRQLLEVASSQQDPIKTAAPAPSYGEFVQRQNAYLKGQAATAAQSFWLSQVDNTFPHEWSHTLLSAPSMGHDYRQMHTWAFFSIEDLTAWSKLYGTSWFRIATSVIGLVMAGHSMPTPHHDHTLQVAFGAREPKFSGCISHMANTMPIKQPVSTLLQNGSTFADLVRNVSKRMSQAKKHEMFPFISLLEAAQRELDGETSVASKVVVTFSPKLADKRCTLYPVQGVWDLFFCFLEHDDGVSLGVIADPTIFDVDAVDALKADFLSTVRLSQSFADFELCSVSYLQDRGIATLSTELGMTATDVANSSRVTDWIRHQATTQPNAVALFSGEENTSVNYGELDGESDSKALYIQELGLVSNDVVVLHIDRSFDTVVWILAILKSGASYVVLEKNLPLARKQAILRVAEAKLFVTDLVDEALFADCAKTPKVLNARAKTIFPSGRPRTAMEQHPSDIAYTVFTSGSTGQPKAIMVEHQNLSSYVSSTKNVVKLGRGSRVLQFATFAFDASVFEWAVTLSYGATICFVNHPSLLVGDYLADMIDTNKINMFHTTPSVLSTVPSIRRLPSLKIISVGGEASSAGLLDKWSKKVLLIHAYGPTETTVICANEVVAPTGKMPSPSNIGFANPGTTIMICPEGSDQNTVQGQSGEICIVGPQVTRGYRGQPELTAEKFRTIEFQGKSTRMYRSGDKGYLDIEGKLHILGRLNNREIKLRGYRLDLPAIEKSILDHCPEVMTASVQVIDESLFGFVCPSTVQTESIRDRISRDLPSYSVPREFMAVKDLPLNANGKVDHKQVLEQFSTGRGVFVPQASEQADVRLAVKSPEAAETDASRTCRFETAITALWQEVLGLGSGLSLDVTFYDAGGHSILLTALHKKIMARYSEAKMSLLDVFYNPTIRRQAAHLSQCLVLNAPSSSAGSSVSYDKTSTTGAKPSRTFMTSASELDDDLFAIVGMSGRFPGADSVEEMWNLLIEQRDGITTSDGSGAKDAKLQEGEVFIPRYGSVGGLDDFQGKDWAMSDEEASNLDPQKRMFLMIAKQALEDASVAAPKAEGTNIGTFVGIAHNTFQHSDSEAATAGTFESRYRVVLDPNASTFTAYKLNLTGPSIDVNTACASSLVAMHQAINSLRAGDCDTALVGGVSLSYPQLGGYVTSDGKIFSISGECRPLDARSDGSVPADGVAAVVLKPLGAANAAGDRIYAVIEGHAIGTDGAVDKIGFTVPSSSGQAKVVRDAIINSGVNPQAIRYVEMHGSGTSIGDALEAQGLERGFAAAETAFFGGGESSTTSTRLTSGAISPASGQSRSGLQMPNSPATKKLLVGSNKGSFGNSETASGLFSLIKASLAVWKGVMPPMRQLGEVNGLIDLSKALVQPLQSHLKLERGDRIGVTALGYGGVNAHCIVASLETIESRVRS